MAAAAVKLSSVSGSPQRSTNRLDESGIASSTINNNSPATPTVSDSVIVTADEAAPATAAVAAIVKTTGESIVGHHSRVIVQASDNDRQPSVPVHTYATYDSYDALNNHHTKISEHIRDALLISHIGDSVQQPIEESARIRCYSRSSATELPVQLDMVQRHHPHQHLHHHHHNDPPSSSPTTSTSIGHSSIGQSVIIQNIHSRQMHNTSPLRYTAIDAGTESLMALEAQHSPLHYSTLQTSTLFDMQHGNGQYLNNNHYDDWNYESLDLRQKPSNIMEKVVLERKHHLQQQQHNHLHQHHHTHLSAHTVGIADNNGHDGASHAGNNVIIVNDNIGNGSSDDGHNNLMSETSRLSSLIALTAVNNQQHFDDIHAAIVGDDHHQTNISAETAAMRTGLHPMYTATNGTATLVTVATSGGNRTSNGGGSGSGCSDDGHTVPTSASGNPITVDEVIADTLKDEQCTMSDGTNGGINGSSVITSGSADETTYLHLSSAGELQQLKEHSVIYTTAIHNHSTGSSGGDSRSPSGLSQEDYEGQTFANLSNATHSVGQREVIYSNSLADSGSLIHPMISYESPLHSSGAGISTR